MTPEVFNGVNANDQYTFDQTPNAQAVLQNHWSSYFVEADVQRLASYGINALRIPIGYWAYDNTNTPYLDGADAYLEGALQWARNANMTVWVDLHGAPGSQNGFDNSGRAGEVDWQRGDNQAQHLRVLSIIASKYGSNAYADVVVGIELVNEPISWGNNKYDMIQQWAGQAYTTVRDAAENKNLQIIMHDAFQASSSWLHVSKNLNAGRHDPRFAGFGVDTHLYQLYVDEDNQLDQDGHVAKACGWAQSSLQPGQNGGLPMYAGEWTAITNVCVNPDGSTIAGKSTRDDCKLAGCQCAADTPTEQWSEATKAQVKRFVDAQLATFEKNGAGYFFWSFKGPGAWGFYNGIEGGWIPNPVDQFTDICSEGVIGRT
ncbi:glycoside hydrolase family 5 protein [Aulographum hederae CBS 113979]|uniref:glucan 1,3-beta-glucosidase n=1 Tax=Aulographum hederae CBS 113979 TaxID=1176131 RepID=A0A6G1HCC0_9PEZI|nr:glycoside hydrolase family 5 protein [Aulographum hederae CBS 113979]